MNNADRFGSFVCGICDREFAGLRSVPGFVGYLISGGGALFSQLRPDGKGVDPDKLRRIQPRVDRVKGYPVVGLQVRPGHQVHRFLHRVVIESLIGPPPFAEAQVRHLDNVKAHCCIANLAWGTKLENEADKDRFGTRPRGVRHWHARLTEDDVRRIRELRRDGMKLDELASMFGVYFSTISKIVNRATWKEVA